MGNTDVARLDRVREDVVRALDAAQPPAVLLQPLYQFPAFHVVCNTQGRGKASTGERFPVAEGM